MHRKMVCVRHLNCNFCKPCFKLVVCILIIYPLASFFSRFFFFLVKVGPLKVDFVLQVIILARESGLKLELTDIPVESLVPEPLKVRTNFCHSFQPQS